MNTIELIALVCMFVLIAAIWVPSIRIKMAIFFVMAITGMLSGWVEPVFIASSGLMLVVALWARHAIGKVSTTLAYTSVVIVALALGVHLFPGYGAISLLPNTQITDLTGWEQLRFMVDKPMVGVVLLSVFYQDRLIKTVTQLKKALSNSMPFTLVGIVMVYGLGLAIGYVQFDWSPSVVIFLWLARNLFFTVVAEEALFRGVIMDGLAKWWTFKHSAWAALMVSSILFGIAHIAGGMEYVFLASISGAIYGYAMMRSGRIEMAILAHLLLNTGHILILSY